MYPEEVWFSHKEKKYEVKNRKFKWTDEELVWDWDKCTIGLARTLKNKLVVVVRSKTNKNSRYLGNKPVELRYMLGFEVTGVSEPKTETYTARENFPKKKEGPKQRWVFQLEGAAPGDNYWIWDWAKEGGDIGSSGIYELYKSINEELSNPSKKSDNIFDVELKSGAGEFVPVIYQPAVDSMDNFVREVHCARTEKEDVNEVEVSIIFNNERLRRHAYGGVVNKIYEIFRRFHHGRILDVETFKVLVRKEVPDNKFIFEKIYSDNNDLQEDDVHGDKAPAPERNIKYYFMNNDQPVVFINTSNHAMAEHDANHHLWKWEYVPWLDNAPIKFGKKTREEIEEQFK